MIKKIPDLVQISLIAVLLGVLLAIDDFVLPSPLLHEYKWYLLLFFAVQSILTTFITSQGLTKDPEYFQGFFFSAMLVRMFLSIGVIFFAVYQGVISPFLFVGTFFILYFCFVSFEIYSLLHNLRANSGKSPEEEQQAQNLNF
ncbi:MAG: hypothetical protein MUC49_06355 [Raineya sp.]|jgi:hypothetical protein|nr:hypothetical protein [Raineya sp.]